MEEEKKFKIKSCCNCFYGECFGFYLYDWYCHRHRNKKGRSPICPKEFVCENWEAK